MVSCLALNKTACFPLITSDFLSMMWSLFIVFICLVSVRELSFVFSFSSLLRCHFWSDRAVRIAILDLNSLSAFSL